MRLLLTLIAVSLALAPAAAQTLELERLDARSLGVKFVAPAPATWAQLIDKTRQLGKFRPGEDEMPANFTLSNIRGETSKAHAADYMSLWGWGVPSNFIPSYATLVSEDWAIPADGNWHIDQWIVWLDLEGKPTRALHNQLVETMNRTVLEDRTQGVPIGNPEFLAKLETLRALWDAYRP